MCFNKEVSAVVFLFGLLFSIKLFMNGQEQKELGFQKKSTLYNLAGIFLFFINLMQLNEFFLWSYQNKQSTTHQIWSSAILYTLAFQMIAMYAANIVYDMLPLEIMDENGISKPNPFFWAQTILFGIYCVTLIYGSIFIVKKNFGKFNSTPSKGSSCQVKGASCRLRWDVMTQFRKQHFWWYLVHALTYFASMLLFTYVDFGWIGFGVSGILLVLAFIYGFYYDWKDKSAHPEVVWGSIWCFMIMVIGSFVILFGNNLFEDSENSEKEKEKI